MPKTDDPRTLTFAADLAAVLKKLAREGRPIPLADLRRPPAKTRTRPRTDGTC